MLSEEHPLLKEAWSNFIMSVREKGRPSKLWILPQDLERNSNEKLYPIQRYDYAVHLQCETLVEAFEKLEKIRNITSRNIYRKKNEDKGELLRDWMLYNYEFYNLSYQSVLDICLLLINEVFDLGIPYKKCSLNEVCSNRRIKGTAVGTILQKINITCQPHREVKNLLLHRGQRIALPLKRREIPIEDVNNFALKYELKTNYAKQLFEEIFAVYDRKQLIKIMTEECTMLEKQVEKLFDSLLPHYRKIRQLYNQP